MVQNGTEWIVCVLIKLKTMIVVQLTSYLCVQSIVQFWCRDVHLVAGECERVPARAYRF